MQVTVKRTFKGPEYTIGKMYLDGHYLCDMLKKHKKLNILGQKETK